MNKQIIQKLINIANEAMRIEPTYIIIEVDKEYYNCYEEITVDEDHIGFVDDDDNKVVLDYNEITSVKLSNI